MDRNPKNKESKKEAENSHTFSSISVTAPSLGY